MTEFENKLLYDLLAMKQKELMELSVSSELKLNSLAVKQTAVECGDLKQKLFFIEVLSQTLRILFPTKKRSLLIWKKILVIQNGTQK